MEDTCTTRDLETFLMDALAEYVVEDDLYIDDVRTYEQSGVMTCNQGLVIRMSDGTEFQVTIVQSR